MIDINKINLDKRYDIFELIGLTFKLVHKNISKLVKTFFTSILLAIGVGILGSMFLSIAETGMSSSVDALFTKVNNAMMRRQSLFSVLDTNELIFYVLFALEIFVIIYIIMWVIVRSVVSIDTGIESIESKKISVPTGNAFLKILGAQIIVGMVLITISFLSRRTPTVIYIFLFIQIQILTFLVNQFARFSYFELLAKGKNIQESFSNSLTNLFFSKNKLILKSAVGEVLVLVAYIVISLVIVGGGALLAIMFMRINNVSLATFVAICTLIVYIVITWYYTYYITTYSYLVYMLNEVRDDKVGNLK